MATFLSPRRLSGRELLPALGVAVGVGLGAGLLAGYVARLFLMRERLEGGAGAAPHVRAPAAAVVAGPR
jgi:hypothetical protein